MIKSLMLVTCVNNGEITCHEHTSNHAYNAVINEELDNCMTISLEQRQRATAKEQRQRRPTCIIPAKYAITRSLYIITFQRAA